MINFYLTIINREYNESVVLIRKKITMNKLVKCSAAALLAASLFGFGGQSVNAATGYQGLTHNAYAYTHSGKRANNKLYKKGSKVKVIGSIKLNGKKYNIISGNVYIKASNFAKRRSRDVLGDGYETQLLHNSYVYNAKGQRIKGTKLRKGHSVTCYGNPIRIHGKKYVQIGNGRFVRSSNVLLSYNGPTGSDSLNHTHHNVSGNTSNTTRQHSSNNSNSTANNGSNSSSNQSNSSSTSSTNKGNSTTNKSNSSSSTTDKKDQSKSDTSKKDLNKKNQSKPDSKIPSKSTDNKGTKDNSKTNAGLATEADYVALNNVLQKVYRSDAARYSTQAKRNAYNEVFRKANSYLIAYKLDNSTAPSVDIQKAISDLNTAFSNLDGPQIKAQLPQVTVEVYPNGLYKILWDSDKQRQAVLDIVNKVYGSSDARFENLENDNEIVFTNNQGLKDCTVSTLEFIKSNFINK